MSQALRAVVSFGVAVPLAALAIYWVTLDSSSSGPERAVERPSPVGAKEPVSRSDPDHRPVADTPASTASHTSDPTPDPSDQQTFSRPESERRYWQELESLEKRDKEKALAYAIAGEKWYGDEGKPAQARRAKIVTLLVDTGDMEQARERTRRFLERYPDSPYRPLVQGMTGIYPRPGAPPPSAR